MNGFELATTLSPRSKPYPLGANQNNQVPVPTEPPAPSRQKQKPQNTDFQSTSKLPVSTADSLASDYLKASWFIAGNGDLLFAKWLLMRCDGIGDVTTLQSAATLQRMFALFKIQRKLRLELSWGSKREETENENEVEIEEEDPETNAEEPWWPVEEIVEQVQNVLRASRLELNKQQKEAERLNRKIKGTLERVVVAEIVENATELLLSRATCGHETLLRRWINFLKHEDGLSSGNKVEENAFQTNTVNNATSVSLQKSKKRKQKAQLRKNKWKAAEETACEQVETFLTFLTESTQVEPLVEATVTVIPSETEKMWSLELYRIVELSRIEPEEEERRLCIALDIQNILRQEVSKWRQCDVVLFGSSLTQYGSQSSDLDMCLLPNGRRNVTLTDPLNEKRIDLKDKHQLGTDSEEAIEFQDLYEVVQNSIKNHTQTLNQMDRSGKNDDKSAKQRRQLEFFLNQLCLLRNAIIAKLTKLPGVEKLSNGLKTKSAHVKSVIAASRRRRDDLYLLRAILQRAGNCEIRNVIAGARIPIIRFLHTRSGRDYECDLCLENVLATRNTPLLRAYASFDGRARALGIAVKYWAKQRGINDASTGCLSSYSFVLLSIFYLQVMHVLPNLQDPDLLESANIHPDYYNDINIAFCDDRALAQAFHQRASATDSSNVSLATLLVGFFKFYATEFDFAKHVVTVRSPKTPALKIEQWDRRKAKTWRISIQDPLEVGRDLGCVLQFKGQEKIIHEFRRAHKMLIQGESFSDKVFASENLLKGSGKQKPKNKDASPKNEEKTHADKGMRSYVLLLRSADEELTKEKIELLFKTFKKSFRVGTVVKKRACGSATNPSDEAGSKNAWWEVELLTSSPSCPRALALRTRIDWNVADGRMGRVWLHHQASFATPPCEKCFSPKHTSNNCLFDDSDDKGAGAGDRGEPRTDHNVAERDRHVLRLTLDDRKFTARSQQNNRRKKQHQLEGPPHDIKSKQQFKRSTDSAKRKVARENKTMESQQIAKAPAVWRLKATASMKPSLAQRGECESENAGKATRKTKRWQRRVIHEKSSS
ncbi:hypothetical protein PsorP6_018408 [Peronosclerospora sorghi]|nr:hypothetical protein PsorP6_018408 [Peronosclerospora sorghi]